MFIKTKKVFLKLAESSHIFIFGHGMGNKTRIFLDHLSWSFVGGLLASMTMLGVNVVAGRLMGPVEYGKYGLVLVISQMLMIPIIFGLDITSVRSISMAKNASEKAKNISGVFYFVIFSSLIVAGVYLLFHRYVAEKFDIQDSILLLGIVYAVITSLKSIADSFARGLFLFREQFLARILEVGTTVAFFCFFFLYYGKQDYTYYILALLGGSTLFCLWLGKGYRPYLVRFDGQYLKKQLSFSSWLLLGTIFGTAFNSLDKLIIVKYLSIYDLGVYMAYFIASTNLIAQATQVFINVLFPQISSLREGNVVERIEKLLAILFIPGCISIGFMVWIIIFLFGKNFDLKGIYVVSFGVLGMLQIVYTIYASIIMAVSKKLYKKFFLVGNLVNLVHIGAYGLLIFFRQISIMAIVILLILNLSLTIYLQRKMLKKYFDQTFIPGYG